MELRQIISMLRDRKKIIIFPPVAFLFLAFIWQASQPEKYEVIFPIEVSRENYQQTDDYRYDQFYRLQADERYADTVVQWLQSGEFSQMVAENFRKESDSVLRMQQLKGERLSSSYIQASFTTLDPSTSSAAADAIEKSLQEKNRKLNEKAQDPSWFHLSVGEIQVASKDINNWIIFAAAAALGVILGVFGSFFHYYFSSNEDRN